MVIVSKQMGIPLLTKQLSDYAEGDIVKIPENNTPVEFYVAKHNYESGLNGNGRTLVVRKDCYDKRQRDISGSYYDYANSNIDTWLNGAYKNLLSDNIQNLIETTKFYYTESYNNIGILNRAIFLLSATELGYSDYYINIEGVELSISNILKITFLNNIATSQWTRSTNKYFSGSILVTSAGNADSGFSSEQNGSRPVFTLPSTTKFDSNNNVIIG